MLHRPSEICHNVSVGHHGHLVRYIQTTYMDIAIAPRESKLETAAVTSDGGFLWGGSVVLARRSV